VAARGACAAIGDAGNWVLDARSPDAIADRLRAFRQGLKELGFIEDENVKIVYRWAEDQNDRLPALVADLVRWPVVVIASGGAVPIVFAVPQDPVGTGLVASLARPGGNLTGVNFFTTELSAKRLELLRELVPGVTRVAVLVNPANPNTEPTLKEVEAAARSMSLQVQVFNASSRQDIDAVFAALVRERPDGLFIGGDSFFISRRVQLTNLTVRHAIPAAFSQREYAEIGGLMSYGSNIRDAYRQVGVYAGRILKGAKPADPACRATDQVRVGHQRLDCQDVRPHRARQAARRRRRGD
jgi:putative tryptophan/tyrosine transport system substrate-binding protein